jgi:membrane-bound lytic murein transglycosylase F
LSNENPDQPWHNAVVFSLWEPQWAAQWASVGNRFARLLVVLSAILLVACDRVEPPPKADELVIGILPGPTTYQEQADIVSGFEHDLIESFAASQNLRTHYVVLKDQDALFAALRQRKIQLAAGSPISANPPLIFSTPIQESKQVLIGNNDDWSAHDDDLELDGRSVETLSGSPQALALHRLAGDPPRFKVIEVKGVSDLDLLKAVAEAETALVASDMLNYSLALNAFPDLVVVKELPDKIRSGWAFMPENLALLAKAEAFMAAARKNGNLAKLQDRYFGHIQRIKSDGIARYIHDIRTLLPRYRKQFEAAQATTGIDWRMLAALAYQESKWDPQATSFTNVRGIMMLTEDTADRMGVTDRLDPGQSIRAGARYLSTMRDELPDEIQEPDRTWMALAAYNLGMGHMNGGRTFAKQLKRDPNSWYDMKKVLPLMSQPEFYNRLKAGPARGGEAVVLVENIRNYYDILCKFEPAWQLTPRLVEFDASRKKSGKSIGESFFALPEKAAKAFAESTRVDLAPPSPPAKSNKKTQAVKAPAKEKVSPQPQTKAQKTESVDKLIAAPSEQGPNDQRDGDKTSVPPM